MGSSENFSLRWNDFGSNISSSFQELRNNLELFDVTLCCDNGSDTIQAHKVVLAACSPLFRRILAHNGHQTNPFLYLKGVNRKDLLCVLDFMYNGEVSIGQDDLNSFLRAAEDLAVKGLTSDGDSETKSYHNAPNQDDLDGVVRSAKRFPSGSGKRSSAKRPKKMAPTTSGGFLLDEDDVEQVKSEPVAAENVPDMDESDELFGGGEEDDEFDETLEKFDEEATTTATTTTAKGTRGGNRRGTGDGTSENSEPRAVLEEARFSRTKQGNALLIDKAGYCYLINRKSERKIYWKCQRKTTKNCRSNCQTEGFYITRKTADHTHPPYPPPRNKYTEDY